MEPVSDESGAPPSSGQRTAVEHAFAPLGTDAAGAQADVAVPGWLANSPAWARVGLLAVAHFPIFWLAYGLAFALRFDFSLPPRMAELFWISLPWVAVCKLLIFYLAGHYHGWWRHVTFADLISLLKAAGLSLLVLAALDHFALPLQIPRSVLVLDCLFTILLLGALRASWRLVRPVGGRCADANSGTQSWSAPGTPAGSWPIRFSRTPNPSTGLRALWIPTRPVGGCG